MTQDPNMLLYITPDGSKTYLASTADLFVFSNCTSVRGLYYETYFQFNGCDTMVNFTYNPSYSDIFPNKPTGVVQTLVTMMYYAVQMNSHFGIQSICDYHERYCNGTNQQFADFAECKRFMTELPNISPKCGLAGSAGGNSTSCRFKHHYLIPLDPSVHCFHIGYGHRHDRDGHLKCNDELECFGNYTTNKMLGDPSLVSHTLTPEAQNCVDRDKPYLFNGPTPDYAEPT